MGLFFDRLREERERLGLSQEKFGAAGGVQKRAQINYENGERKPDAEYLELVAKLGVDVVYLVTGERDPAALDTSERLLLDRYRACPDAARQHLLQTAVLLASGLAPAGPAPSPTRPALQVATENGAITATGRSKDGVTQTVQNVSGSGHVVAGGSVNYGSTPKKPRPA